MSIRARSSAGDRIVKIVRKTGSYGGSPENSLLILDWA
jgi:hypothetical protein